MKAFLSVLLVATSLAAVSLGSPIVQPSTVYGLPSGPSDNFRHFRASRALGPSSFRPAPAAFHPGLTPPAPQPAAASAWNLQRAAPRLVVQQRPAVQTFQQPQLQRQLQTVPQSYFRLAPQPPPPQQQQQQQQQQRQQQYVTEQQGVWRYSRPARPQPLREDQAPHQGLGATDSVTMPEAAPYDPLLVTGPAAAHFVRALTDREPHFFPAFPHTRLVLSNQQKRLDNGLHANRLGSIRVGSDFLRGD